MAALVALTPLIYLIARTGSAGWATIWDILARPRTVELSVASLGLAAAVAGTCIAVGVPLAWLLTRTALPGGRLWLVVAALPLAVPSYVAAYTWLAAFPGMQGFAPAWAVLSLVSLPYVVLPVAAVLAQVDPASIPVTLVAELADAEARVLLARRFHNDAVTDVLRLRRNPLVRGFRLAGYTELPRTVEFDDDVSVRR